MNKPKTNYVVDLALLASFFVAAVSGLALKFSMPGGARQGRLQEFLGISRGAWLEIHDWSGIIMIILVVIHLALHWNWIACMTKGMFHSGECEIKEDENVK